MPYSPFNLGPNIGLQSTAMLARRETLGSALSPQRLPQPIEATNPPWYVEKDSIRFNPCDTTDGQIVVRLSNSLVKADDNSVIELALQCQGDDGIWRTSESQQYAKRIFTEEKDHNGFLVSAFNANKGEACRIVLFDPPRNPDQISNEDKPIYSRSPNEIVLDNIVWVGPHNYKINNDNIEIEPVDSCGEEYRVKIESLIDETGKEMVDNVKIVWPNPYDRPGPESPNLPVDKTTVVQIIDPRYPECPSKIYLGPYNLNTDGKPQLSLINAVTDCTRTSCNYTIRITGGNPPFSVRAAFEHRHVVVRDFTTNERDIILENMPCTGIEGLIIEVEALRSKCKATPLRVPGSAHLPTNLSEAALNVTITPDEERDNPTGAPCNYLVAIQIGDITYGPAYMRKGDIALYKGQAKIVDGNVIGGTKIAELDPKSAWPSWLEVEINSRSQSGYFTAVVKFVRDDGTVCQALKTFYIPPCDPIGDRDLDPGLRGKDHSSITAAPTRGNIPWNGTAGVPHYREVLPTGMRRDVVSAAGIENPILPVNVDNLPFNTISNHIEGIPVSMGPYVPTGNNMPGLPSDITTTLASIPWKRKLWPPQ